MRTTSMVSSSIRSRSRVLWLAVALLSAVLGVGASACSSSVLIRADDSGFARARERLARAQVAASSTGASQPEQLLFLQAESFYQYRFAVPARGVGASMAQIAAVAVELPAFQALAGSLDLLDLRLRSYDAAIQLWETLLAQRPTTPLRPLVLYRLGWAYRSTGVAGLPRSSGDEAFSLLSREQPGSPLAVLAQAAGAVPWKSKSTATGLSIVPGLGQIYAGERLNGASRLAIALAAAAMIIVPSVLAYQRREDLTWSGDWPLLATAFGGLVILNVDYTLAYQDAVRAVVEFNERAEDAFDDRHPEAP